MRHRSDTCCDGTQRLTGEREGGRGMHCHETSSMNSSEVLTCTHDSNSLERRRGGREGKEGGREGKRRSGMGREKKREKGEKEKEEKKCNHVTCPLDSLVPRPSLSTRICTASRIRSSGNKTNLLNTVI